MSDLVKGNAERVDVTVGDGPGGVSVGVLVAVGSGVGVDVLVGKMGVMDGVNVGRRVFVAFGGVVGSGTMGVQVGSSGFGVAVGVRVGTTAATAAVGAATSSCCCLFSTEASGVRSNMSGMKKTAINPAISSKVSAKNRIANTF